MQSFYLNKEIGITH